MNLEQFFDESDKETNKSWGSSLEKEIKLRIKLCVAAYAYEIENTSIVCDAEFDNMCAEVNLKNTTGNRKIDRWFKQNFDPSTGQWIHSHPELNRIKQLYEKYYKK